MSSDYHDYVFKNGELVGEFDKMYRQSTNIPWHQDKTAHQVFVDLDIAIIKHYIPLYNIQSLCDLGCGLGYVSSRLESELTPLNMRLKVTGLDTSEDAINKARLLHPNVKFISLDILKDDLSSLEGTFDLLYVKDIFWYIIHQLDKFIETAKSLLKDGGLIYVMQSVPDLDRFYGSDIFPSTFSIADLFSKHFKNIYTSSTYEVSPNQAINIYQKDRYVRFLGSKIIPIF